MRSVCVVLVCVASVSLSHGQQSQPVYVTGVEIHGVNEACPKGTVFIGKVEPKSPADVAGIHAGDLLLAINNEPVRDLRDAVTRIRATGPDPVILQIRRDGTVLTFTVRHEPRDVVLGREGLRMLDDGFAVGTDYTSADIAELRRLNSELDSAVKKNDFVNVFPGHYPKDKSLYYPGFEIFEWNEGRQVHVGGIEEGPAKRAGVRWGDRIISENGQSVQGKSLAQLENLFSSSDRTMMRLVVERTGVVKSFTFPLARAADVLKENGWRMVEGKMIPLWLPDEYLKCFE
ncbi:MAG TPA: PDZ domain-containing protein [Terracidiphilus sp.]|nr:PDZ domain-containing protein [Terracidiphilus sp.]